MGPYLACERPQAINRTPQLILSISEDRPHNCRNSHPGAAKPADLSANGTQLLFDRCTATGDNVFYIAVGPGQQGPNVVLDCIFHGNGHVRPHQRWSTGLLIDGFKTPKAAST